ncbi:MAG: response regulator [Deltaproteobacteria bacterium]|jgi:two-component system chemotaxis response regulator CheY|nr:response regulator [Deltaproteobacteria bacterium]
MKVIIADDSKVMRNIIQNAMRPMGTEVIQAGSGHEVLQQLEIHDGKIEAIFMDWNMPGMTGLDCLKILKKNEKYKDIPVLMISTESEDDKMNIAKKAGAKGYLTKPFTNEELIKFINSSI